MDICPGTTLGRYELLVPIAAGGMAQVWAARQHGSRGFSKVVAVKLLLTELIDDPHFQQMFLDEAELASRIKHPNVTQILDLGEQEGVLYQAMEYVDGEPLQAVLREQKSEHGLPLDLVVRIVSQACAGLHAAHELRDVDGRLLNLVHRDVTPHNLLVTYDGQLKILDFGVAKATSNLQQTTVGQMKGKVPYMAPEQARGEPVDRRTDIFALGVVLYQLATGRHPFRGDNDLITLRAITASTPVAPPEDMIEGFPEDLNEVIVRALSKDRNDRFATMEEMGQALDRAALRLPIGTEDLGSFMRRLLGHRGDARRAAIREASQRLGGDTATATPVAGIPQVTRQVAAPPAQPFQPSPSSPQAVTEAWASQTGDRETPLPDSSPTLIDPNILERAHHMDRPTGPGPMAAPPPEAAPKPAPPRHFPMPAGPLSPQALAAQGSPSFPAPTGGYSAPAAPVMPAATPAMPAAAPAMPPAPMVPEPAVPPPQAAAQPFPQAASPAGQPITPKMPPVAPSQPPLQIAPAPPRAPKSMAPPPSAMDEDLERLAAATATSGGQSKSVVAGLVALVVLIVVIVVAISMAPDSDAPEIPVVPPPPPAGS
jgi:eukaryotic-like serine/threonine-protein kinase